MKTPLTGRMRKMSPLLYPAAFLSIASLAWTTWSLVDLLGTGKIGVTVAVGADVIWGSVILAEARGLRIPIGKKARNLVPAFGWATLLVVAVFLAWHGVAKDSLAMAAAGPFLPFGAKTVWALALADMRDPSALTDKEKSAIASMERGMLFEEQQHRIEMRRREMGAERQMSEVSVDFDIELMRQDKTRELMRRRPLELSATDAGADAHRISEAQQAHRITDAPAALTAAQTQRTMLDAAADRTAAVGEAADGTSDAPLVRTAPTRVEAPHNGDAAPRLDGMSKAAAVRVMREAHPAASAPQIVERLAHHGIDADAAYVRTVLSRNNQKRNATDGGYL
ncbi:hypothetical protein ACIBI8_37065 [Streptomyces sp. NPDC050529]|uniref:hypothetical protein n=1 Tax=Streptomyces sp. NPDC050529 TaxID=3365624 RepID=UPI0037A5AC62